MRQWLRLAKAACPRPTNALLVFADKTACIFSATHKPLRVVHLAARAPPSRAAGENRCLDDETVAVRDGHLHNAELNYCLPDLVCDTRTRSHGRTERLPRSRNIVKRQKASRPYRKPNCSSVDMRRRRTVGQPSFVTRADPEASSGDRRPLLADDRGRLATDSRTTIQANAANATTRVWRARLRGEPGRRRP